MIRHRLWAIGWRGADDGLEPHHRLQIYSLCDLRGRQKEITSGHLLLLAKSDLRPKLLTLTRLEVIKWVKIFIAVIYHDYL